MAGKFIPNKKLPNELQGVLSDSLSEVALEGEQGAKRELYPGHGYITGNLQRRLHVATPDYTFSRDDLKTKRVAPKEFGGKLVKPKQKRGDRFIQLVIGVGLSYSMAVHQGHHSFSGYHFITKQIPLMVRRFPSIVKEKLKGHKA